MITFLNILILINVILSIICFIYVLYEELKDRPKTVYINRRKSIAQCMRTATGASISLFIIMAMVIILLTCWQFFVIDKVGYYTYDTEYKTENIIYNTKYSGEKSVFIDGKLFACDEIQLSDKIDDYKIMSSTHHWDSEVERFFCDSIFYKEKTKYLLLIPEKFAKED